MTTALRRWGPVVGWAVCIFLLSTESFSGEHTGSVMLPLLRLVLPGASEATLELVHAAVRKLAHLTEYFVLSSLVFTALRDGGTPPARARVEAVLFAAAYAVSDEFHQRFVSGRTPAAHDVLVDVAGAMLAQLAGAARTVVRARA